MPSPDVTEHDISVRHTVRRIWPVLPTRLALARWNPHGASAVKDTARTDCMISTAGAPSVSAMTRGMRTWLIPPRDGGHVVWGCQASFRLTSEVVSAFASARRVLSIAQQPTSLVRSHDTYPTSGSVQGQRLDPVRRIWLVLARVTTTGASRHATGRKGWLEATRCR